MSKIISEINEHFKSIIQSKKDGIISSNKKQRDFYKTRYEYLLVQAQQLVVEELKMIQNAYVKGLSNENDGVFLVAHPRRNIFTLSREVANEMEKHFKDSVIKLDEEKIISLLKKEIRKDKPITSYFIRNECAVHLFSGQRRKEVIDDFFKRNTSVDDDILKDYNNLLSINVNDYTGNNFTEIALQNEEEEFTKRIKSMIRNTDDLGYILEEILQDLGFKSKDKGGSFPRYYGMSGGQMVSYVEPGLFFNNAKANNFNVFLEVLNNSDKVLQNLNNESENILNLLRYFQRSSQTLSNFHLLNLDLANEVTSKIFQNIENWTLDDIDQIQTAFLYIFDNYQERTNVKRYFREEFDKIDLEKLREIKDGDLEQRNLFKIIKKRKLLTEEELNFADTTEMVSYTFDLKDLIKLVGAVDERGLEVFYKTLVKALELIHQSVQEKEFICLPKSIPFKNFVDYIMLGYSTKNESNEAFDVSKESFREFNLNRMLPEKNREQAKKKKI